MPPVRRANGGYCAGMGTSGEPVDDLGPDRPTPLAPVSRSNRARLAGNQQHQPRAHHPRLRKPVIKPRMGLIQCATMQIEREIRRSALAREAPLPMRIETGSS